MDLIGYNPVIEADFLNPCVLIRSILENVKDYEEFVNRNCEVAKKYAPWERRMEIIQKELQAFTS